MFKTLIAGVTAIALTLSTASPAQAQGLDEDDIGKILFGLLATAAIGAAIRNARDDDRRPQVQQHQPRYGGGGGQSTGNNTGNNDRSMRLPRGCLVNVETRFGEHRMFGRRCLQRNYAQVADLPRRCAVRVFAANGNIRRGFDPQCLRAEGYRARRH